jgi:phosphatidylserine decarboxylase
MSIAPEGLRFILPAAGLAVLFAILGLGPLAVLFFLLACAFTFFFRDPERVPPAGEDLIVSPADGEVLGIEAIDHDPALGGAATRVVIFLSLLDVHFVRAPLAGTVASVEHRPGKFLQAFKPEAGELNESTTLALKGGPADAVMKMSVGVAARRIKTYVKPGAAVRRGEKVGLMFFGSRVELTLARTVAVKAALHDKVKGGTTVIGEARP